MAKELKGIQYIKCDNYSVFCVHSLSEEIKCMMRIQLSKICNGDDYSNSGRKMYNYKKTLEEFLKRLKNKEEEKQMAMIGEFLVHFILLNYYDEFKSITPFFNMEERSVKKGYDVVLTETNNPSLWLVEVKSGELHKNKDSNRTMNDLIGEAKRDLVKRLNEENCSLWMEAINAARISFDSKSSMKDAVLDILMSWGDDASDGVYTSADKNVILSGVLFSNLNDPVTQENINKLHNRVKNNNNSFKDIVIISIQKETYIRIFNFLKEEVLCAE